MKKIYITISFALITLLLLLGVLSLLNRSTKKSYKDEITPTSSIQSPDYSDYEKEITPGLNQEQKEQLEADKEFGEWTRKIYENYPWYNELPLQNEKYFIYFDIYQKKFISDIYVSSEADNLKKEMQARLQEIGVNISLYEFVWNVK